MASYFEYFKKRTVPIIRKEGPITYVKKAFALLATFVSKKTLNKDKVRDDFFKLYYLSEKDQRWLGMRAEKCPTDAWAYQELIFRTKPDFIIETGTCEGGGALFFASILDLMGKGKVITVDVEKHCDLKHPRIIQLTGSSISEEITAKIESLVKGKTVLVSLDSDHSKKHVLKEMELYSRFVLPGGYMVVEDTCINGHPVMPGWGEGPFEAVQEFLSRGDEFIVDRECEKFLLSYNRGGFLKRQK